MGMQIENLYFSYATKNTVQDICLSIKNGEFVGLIGPNGSGKSTILKNIYRALKPDQGSVKLDRDTGKHQQTLHPQSFNKENSNEPGRNKKKVSSGYGVVREKYEYEDLSNIARDKEVGIADIKKIIQKEDFTTRP